MENDVEEEVCYKPQHNYIFFIKKTWNESNPCVKKLIYNKSGLLINQEK